MFLIRHRIMHCVVSFGSVSNTPPLRIQLVKRSVFLKILHPIKVRIRFIVFYYID